MQLARPEVQRVHVTVYDRNRKQSRTLTIYDATVDDVVAKFKKAIGASETKIRRKATAAS